MKVLPTAAAALLFTGVSHAALAQTAPSSPVPSMAAERSWSSTLAEDATALHDTMISSHPGVYDTLNPGFRDRLDAGLVQALDRAKRTTDAGGWWWALRSYVASFDDGHVQISIRDRDWSFPFQWPGFLTVYRGEDQVVADRDEAASLAQTPPLNAKLLSCDGVSAASLAQTRIGDVRGRWGLEAQRVAFGDWMFLDAGNPWIPKPSVCEFETSEGPKSYTLAWRSIEGPNLADRRTRINQRARPDFGLKEMDGGGYWMSMPNFNGSPDSEAYAELTKLFADAQTQQAQLRDAPYVVLDLRGNGGGSSHWGEIAAKTLWGEAWMTVLSA